MELYNEFFLARELGMTVGEMRRRMSQREFVQWMEWFPIHAQRVKNAQ